MADISNSNSNSLVVGTAGDDSIENAGSNVTINASAGNDTIKSGTSDVSNNNISVNGGIGDDLISNVGDNVTLDGGEGNDSILSGGSNVSIIGGTGNDVISNTTSYSLDDEGTSFETVRSDNVTIDGGDGSDLLFNDGSTVSINGGNGNDTIHNIECDSVTIDGGTGDDYISTYGSNFVSINGGNGNDSILVNYADNVSVYGGAGNDWITAYWKNETSTYIYNEGDGHDTISTFMETEEGNYTRNYSDNFSLLINSSVGWSSVVSGNNIVITVGDGSITLLDAAASSGVNINGVTYPIDTTASVTPDPIPESITPTPTPVTFTPDPTTGLALPTDVVFLIDESGSMGTYIQRVKDAITSFANSLDTTSSDFRFGIVEFGQSDNNGMPIAQTFTAFNGVTPYFTSNVEEFTASLNTNANGSLEYGLSAIQMALVMFQSDPRLSQKRIVVLTDAGYEGDGTEAVDSNVTSDGIAASLAALGVKMDVVGEMNSECQTEYEPLANGTGGKFYDINSLSYYSYFEEIADDILGRSHVNINLNVDTVPEGTTSGVFVVTPTLNAVGAVVPASSDATFKAVAEEGDFVVGYVVGAKAYMAVPESPWRQIVTIPENWIVSGTWQDDALNVTGNNVVVSGSLGRDNISINQDAVNITLVDISELQNGSDTLSFSKKITPGTLQQTFTGSGVALYTTNEAGELDFVLNLSGIAALDESLLNCEVSNAGTPNTIRELIYGEINVPIIQEDLSGRIIFAQWGYGFTPPDDNPLITGIVPQIATSADVVEDFGSPTLDEISPENFAVTVNELPAQNSTPFDVTEAILSTNKSHFKEVLQ